MKKYPLLVIFILVVFFSNAFALDLKGKFALTGNGGLGIPTGDFADKEKGAAKTGFGFGGVFEYFVTNNVALGGVFHYRSFGTETSDLEEFYSFLYGVPVDIDFTQKITEFGAFVEYLFSGGAKASPYLKFGGGFGKYKGDGEVKAEGVSVDFKTDLDSKLYISGGGGIIYMVSQNIALRGEALFTHLTTDGAKGKVTVSGVSEEVEMDSNIQHFSFFAGLTFFFGGEK